MSLNPNPSGRYFPNFIEKRQGNQVHLLTEVIGGDIFRRTVGLSKNTDIGLERETLMGDALKQVEKIWYQNECKYADAFDGKPYNLDNLPSGITILDVINEARREGVISLSGNDCQTTDEDMERYIYAAVERSKKKDK